MDENISSGAEKAENLANGNKANGHDASANTYTDKSVNGESTERANGNTNADKVKHATGENVGREEMRLEQKKNQMLSHERVQKETERLLEKQEKDELLAQKRRNHELLLQIEREENLRRQAERKNKRKNGGRTPNFAGWLTAVVCLSFTVLALATTVIAGWFRLDGAQSELASGYSRSVYELNATFDNLDVNLSKAKIAQSKGEQVRVLTDVVVQSETAETILERFPVDNQGVANLSAFVNKMGESAKTMLISVANGNALTEGQKATIDYMYAVTREYKNGLHEMVAHADEKAMTSMVRGGQNFLDDDFANLNALSFEVPKTIVDGPFAENIGKTNDKNTRSSKDITAPTAEQTVLNTFKDYGIKDVKCTGEALAKDVQVFNVTANSNVGELFVQVAKDGGKIIMFDSYRECTEKTLSAWRCVDVAKDFLSSLGYDGLVPVWHNEDGTACTIDFAGEQDGVILYGDLVKIKVCESTGKVTGMEAIAYARNHKTRNLTKPAITKNMAQSRLCKNFETKSSRLALIPFDGAEVLTYEFFGKCDDNEYFVYVDAATGDELLSFAVVETKQGKYLL